MSISVTCQCGARLEIDEKFLGKEVPCPDCTRMLPTRPAAAPPPLDLPDHRRVSGLAILSLTLAVVGAFTIVGTLAAIGVGILALRRIASQPTKLDGAEFARAGIITGGVLTFVTLTALVSPTVFGIDQFLREMIAAKKQITYPPGENVDTTDVVITRPSSQWGLFPKPNSVKNDILEHFVLYSTRDDAYIAFQLIGIENAEKIEEIQEKVVDGILRSDFIDRIGQLGGQRWQGQPTISERKPGVANKKFSFTEITVDVRLGGINRRMLIEFTGKQGRGEFPTSTVLIGCARANRFDALEEDFRKAFASFKDRAN